MNWVLITNQMVPLLFSPEDDVSMVSKKTLKIPLICPQDSFPLFFSAFLKSVAPEKPQCFWFTFTDSLFFRAALVFLDSDLWKRCRVRHKFMSVLNPVPDILKITGIQYQLSSFYLVCRKFSDLRIWIESLCNYTHWQTWFCNCFTIFSFFFLQTGDLYFTKIFLNTQPWHWPVDD